MRVNSITFESVRFAFGNQRGLYFNTDDETCVDLVERHNMYGYCSLYHYNNSQVLDLLRGERGSVFWLVGPKK